MPQFLRRPLFWGVLVAAVVGYTALGFLAVPRLVTAQARDLVRADYGRELALGEVRFNPYTLVLELKDLALPDADGSPLITFKRLLLDLQVNSLWRRALSFREVIVDGLVVSALVRPGGAVNLADLATPILPPGTVPPPEEPLPAVYVDDLNVQGARVVFTDRDRPEPFVAELAPLAFRVRDLSTHVAEGDEYELDVSVFGDARLHWNGTLELEPLQSAGEFELAGLPLQEVGRFLGESLPLELAAGKVTVRARYDLRDGAAGLQFLADDGSVALRDLSLRTRGGVVDLVQVPVIDLTGLRVDLAAATVDIGAVTAADGVVTAWLEPDGSVNLEALAGPPATASGTTSSAPPVAGAVSVPDPDGGGPAASAVATVPDAGTEPDPDWTVRAPSVDLRNFTVTVEDRALQPAGKVTLAPVDLALAGFTTAPAAALDVTLAMGINGSGRLQAKARTQLETLATDAALELVDLPLADFQPWIAGLASLAVKDGRLGVRGQLAYRLGAYVRPGDDALTFTGDVTVADFRSIDTQLEEAFLNWRSLRLGGIEYVSALAPAPGRLRIREVVTVSPYVRLVIGPDGTTNLDTVLAPPGTVPMAGAADPAAGSTPAVPAAPADAGTATPAMPVRIDLVRISDGATNFADLSIQPQFATGIEKLKGTVRGLSSDPAARAVVELDGQVDRFSPVTIRGRVNPLAAETSLDLAMTFRNLELASFTPYSGRFAGYTIRQGKLSVDLNYLIEGQKLTADHKIVIDQLELGEKVDSPEAVSLPLKLAIALLKDRNGVIDLDLPVTGSLDDPKFRIGPIVWKVLVNLLTKAVTAPFALLGSLFGGGDEVNLIGFAPGTADLTAEAEARIDTLVKALTERPGLELTVPAIYSREADAPRLLEQRFEARVLDASRQAAAGRAAAPDFTAVMADREAYLKLLAAVWRQDAGTKAELPPPLAGPDGTLPDQRELEPRIEALEAALRARIEIADAELAELARQRAVAVQERLLVGTGVAPERVFLVSPAGVPADDGAVIMELAVR
jgi:hypothetical protein